MVGTASARQRAGAGRRGHGGCGDRRTVAGPGGGDGQARPFAGPGTTGGAPPRLPVAHSTAADAASSLEARALSGAAGTIVTALQASSGATNLRRVAGWPIGAVAIGDTVY